MKLNGLTIAQSLLQVKFKSQILLSLLCALMLSCQSGSAYKIKTGRLYASAEESHPNYLAMPLELEPAAKLRKEIEDKEGLKLKSRGEAHITVITPPEFEILKSNLNMKDIEQIAKRNDLLHADIEIVCVGKGQVSKDLATYFLVVKSKKLLKIRSEIETAWRSQGGKGDFKADHFYPHVTLGFTQRDLHEADGVIKDERSCISDVSTR